MPIGTVTAGATMLNVYAGTPESGNADFFMYKNVLYTLVKSGSTYVSVQKSYTVYAAQPAATQQQLAVFDLERHHLPGDRRHDDRASVRRRASIPAPCGRGPRSPTSETQFGLVYGFAAQPTNVTQSGTGVFQFQVTNAERPKHALRHPLHAGSNANVVKVDVPSALPTFMQSWPFSFVASYPLTFETGGYNAFTTFVSETAPPSESFAGARTKRR